MSDGVGDVGMRKKSWRRCAGGDAGAQRGGRCEEVMSMRCWVRGCAGVSNIGRGAGRFVRAKNRSRWRGRWLWRETGGCVRSRRVCASWRKAIASVRDVSASVRKEIVSVRKVSASVRKGGVVSGQWSDGEWRRWAVMDGVSTSESVGIGRGWRACDGVGLRVKSGHDRWNDPAAAAP